MNPDTVAVPREPTEEMLNAARDWSIAKNGRGVGNDQARGCYQAMLSASPALSASEPVAWGYPMSDGKSLAVVSLTKSGRCTTPLFTHHAPSVSQSVETIAAAYEAGALAVHNEWLAAAERGDDPPRGDPEFSEAANDYAQSIAALFEGGM